MNDALGKYLMQLSGAGGGPLGQDALPPSGRKPMEQWNMTDYMQFMQGAPRPPIASQSVDNTSTLGKFIGKSMGMQTDNGLGGTLLKSAAPAVTSALGASGAAGAAGAGAAGGAAGLLAAL